MVRMSSTDCGASTNRMSAPAARNSRARASASSIPCVFSASVRTTVTPDPALRVKLESLPEDIALLQSDEPSKQLEATIRFRKLLSIERNPPIASAIRVC